MANGIEQPAPQPTPWRREGRWIIGGDDWPIGSTYSEADARLIVAAVNACRGLPTAMLEDGIIDRLLEKHSGALVAEHPELRRFLNSSSVL